SILIGRQHITLNVTVGGFLTASKLFPYTTLFRCAPGAEKSDFDDQAWRTLSVPHDWSIEGPFDEKNPAGGAGAFLPTGVGWYRRSEEHTSELQSLAYLVCRLLLEKKKNELYDSAA